MFVKHVLPVILLIALCSLKVSVNAQDSIPKKFSQKNYYMHGVTVWGGAGIGPNAIAANTGLDYSRKHIVYSVLAEYGSNDILWADEFTQISGLIGVRKSKLHSSMSAHVGCGYFNFNKFSGNIFHSTYSSSVSPCLDILAKCSTEIRGNGVGLMAHLNINPKYTYATLMVFLQLGWKWNT